jgi:hypothetical protein
MAFYAIRIAYLFGQTAPGSPNLSPTTTYAVPPEEFSLR